jgi:hypothetical protein
MTIGRCDNDQTIKVQVSTSRDERMSIITFAFAHMPLPERVRFLERTLDIAPAAGTLLNYQLYNSMMTVLVTQRLFCPGPLGPAVGGIRIPIALGSAARFFASSILPFDRLIAGTIHSPQLHRIPCHAYFPTLALHLRFGHSNLPSTAPFSSSGRIQDRGSRK